MNRSLAICIALAACGCATSRSGATRPGPITDAMTGAKCEYLGRLVYDPRQPFLEETRTMGPSSIIWLHRPAGYLKAVENRAYWCNADS